MPPDSPFWTVSYRVPGSSGRHQAGGRGRRGCGTAARYQTAEQVRSAIGSLPHFAADTEVLYHDPLSAVRIPVCAVTLSPPEDVLR